MATLTHEQRAERRAAIAAFCAAGGTASHASIKFGVSLSLVSNACASAGVAPRETQKTLTLHTAGGRLRLIAELVNSKRSYAELAEAYNVSRQAVQQFAAKCVAAGLKVKGR